MEIQKEELIKLFDFLAQKTGESLDFTGFDAMEAKLGPNINGKYLYTKYNEAIRSVTSSCSIQEIKLRSLLSYLGFENYSEYQTFLNAPIPQVLASCFGVWVSFVRQSSDEGLIYQSPVQIYQKNQKAYFVLKGPNTTYSGEMTYANGCLTTLFTGSSGKLFHHIYKIGNRKEPRVLQGIYSGISTADDPIGGRAVLYRSEKAFEEIQNLVLKSADLINSDDPFCRNLGSYFGAFEKNNLRLNRIISFDSEDLKS